MPASNGLTTEAAKREFLKLRRKGLTVAESAKQVGRSVKTVENWRAADDAFKREADEASAALKRGKASDRDPELFTLDFASWRKRFVISRCKLARKSWSTRTSSWRWNWVAACICPRNS